MFNDPRLVDLGWFNVFPEDMREEAIAEGWPDTTWIDTELIGDENEYADMISKIAADSKGLFSVDSVKETHDGDMITLEVVVGATTVERTWEDLGGFIAPEFFELLLEAVSSYDERLTVGNLDSGDQCMNLMVCGKAALEEAKNQEIDIYGERIMGLDDPPEDLMW